MVYDAIVVGSGLGGCAAAAALTGGGKKVLILERMDFIGGRCSSTFKDGFRLDIGCHLLFGCEFGAFEQAAARVGKAGVLKFYHPTKFRIINQDTTFDFDGEKMIFDNRNSDTITIEAAEMFRQTMKHVPSWLIKMSQHMAARTLPAMSRMLAPVAKRFDDITMGEAAFKYFNWPKMNDFIECFQLAGFCTPSWVTSSSEMVRTALQLLPYFKPGMNLGDFMGYPLGGLTAIPTIICEGIVEMGGEVRTGVNVTKILVEGGKVAGVELEDGEVIKAPIVISNGGIKETVAGMVGEDKFDPGYAKNIRELISG
ncbi:MAG: FAD-dependent oxidoreductase, partial [Actinobacteria bacterium]|nr:FAD-dependent oxidoreductase [Actinomycetota bacterium]